MTQIRLQTEGNNTELTVMGHCNAGRINGFDLCCCAVSILVYTLLETLSKLNLKAYKGSYGGGWCYITFSNKSKEFEKAKGAIETIMNGFDLLKKSYPSSIYIEKRREEI